MKQFLFIICLFFAFQGFSQTLNFRFDGQIVDYDTGKKLGEVKVSLNQNGTTIESVMTASNGKYVLLKTMDFSVPFEIVFSKPGMVSKKITFDLAGLNLEDIPAGAEYKPVESLGVELFAKRPNVDFSFLDTDPVAQFKWSTSKGTPDYNAAQEARIRTKIAGLLAKADEGASPDAEYLKALSEADKLFNEKKYEDALTKYEKATEIKPKEKYPKDRILEIDKLLMKEKEDALNANQGDVEYDNLIKAADNFRNSKQYEKAIEKYEEAITKKDEAYPKDEIKKIEQILKEQEGEGAYKQAIEAGDMLYKQKSYKDAKKKFEKALELKPAEAYPKSKLADIEAKLKELEATAEVRKKYDEAVAAADALYDEEKWAEAKTKYEEALSFESGASYVIGRIKLVDAELEKIRIKEANAALIEKLLSEGSTAMIGKKYENALSKYQEVLKLDENNETALQKIPEIEALIAEAKDLQKQEERFNELVSKGDLAVSSKQLELALENYTQALEIKEDVVVKTKLEDVNKRIEEAKAAEQKELDFKNLVEEGKVFFDNQEYASSLEKYEAAKAIKPADLVVNKKIDELNVLLKKENEAKLLDEQVQALLAKGETEFSAEKWEDARKTFAEALSIAPKNEVAIDRMKEVLQRIEEAKKLEELLAEFDRLEKKGDAADTDKKYKDAVESYKEALKLKLEPRVEEKLVAVEAKINDLASEAERDANYSAELKQADRYFSEKNYELAKDRYTAALAIKSGEAYPTEQIAKIDIYVADIEAAKLKEETILGLLDEGSKLLKDKEYLEAKAKYEGVIALEASNAMAKTKISEIEEILNLQELDAEKNAAFEKLKTEGLALIDKNELYPAREKLKEALAIKLDYELRGTLEDLEKTIRDTEEKNEKITTLLAQGQKQIDLKNFETAIMRYEEVLSIDPQNGEAISKLDFINETQSAILDGQALQSEFDNLKSQGFAHAEAEEFDEAKDVLNQALKLKADDIDIPKKIAEIDKIIADKKASETKLTSLLSEGQALYDAKKYEDALKKYDEVLKTFGSNSTAEDKIAEINEQMNMLLSEAEKEAEYQKLKKEGFDFAAAKKWEDARLKLEEANSMKEETAVKMKLDEVIKAIEDEANAAETEAKYARALERAKEYEADKDYETALGKYQEASELKSAESFPKTKIAELTKYVENARNARELNEKYDEFLSKGDQLVEEKKYLEAIDSYNQALKLKPTEKIPVDKAKRAQDLADGDKAAENEVYEKMISAITENLKKEDLERAKELADRATGMRPEDSRPKNALKEIEAIEKRNASYTDLMEKGDAQALASKYDQAISLYEQALTVKPANTEPKDKIAALKELMKESEVAAKELKFQEYLQNGKASEDDLKYTKALENYSNALGIKPTDKFAQEKVSSLKSKLADLARLGITEEQMRTRYNNFMREGDASYGATKYKDAVTAFEGALGLIPDSETARAKLADAQAKLLEVTGKEVEANYKKIVAEADKYFGTKEYNKSIEYYNRALNIKPGDVYPREKLAEIDAILNPMSVTSPELESLGEIYDASLMDGALALRRAEEERQNLKNAKVKNRIDKIKDTESKMLANKEQEHQDAVNDAYAVYQAINIKTQESSVDHQATIELVKQIELSAAEKNAEDQNFNYQAALKTEDVLTEVEKAVALEYAARIDDYGDNTEELRKIEDEVVSTNSGKTENFYTGNVESSVVLSEIVEESIEDNQDRADVRIAEANKVDAVRKNAQDSEAEKSSLTYEKSLSTDAYITEAVTISSDDQLEKSLNPTENEANLKEIQTKAEDEQTEMGQSAKFKTISTDQRITQFNNAYAEEEAAKVENKKQNTESVNQAQNKANEINSAAQTSDNQERLKMENKVTTIEKDQSKTSNEHVQKLQSNTEKITEVTKKQGESSSATAAAKQERLLTNEAKIDSLELKKRNVPVVINSLGKEYPPGVTEENFQQKDENGIMKAIITRRIVVQNGRGDVYVKTQTLSATTYSKNGKPIAEYVWSNETQAAHLQRY